MNTVPGTGNAKISKIIFGILEVYRGRMRNDLWEDLEGAGGEGGGRGDRDWEDM